MKVTPSAPDADSADAASRVAQPVEISPNRVATQAMNDGIRDALSEIRQRGAERIFSSMDKARGKGAQP